MIRSLEGKTPVVHPTAFVSEAAYVIGDVEIGEGSSVWPGTVIRGDTGKITIGRNTNIQDNCVLHSDADAWIGDNVTLGHAVMCHARNLANNVLIGNGATLNDGAEIGEYSIVAAGAVALENTRFPPRSFIVGVPARVKGPVEERHIRMIEETAEHYVTKAQRYKREDGLE